MNISDRTVRLDNPNYINTNTPDVENKEQAGAVKVANNQIAEMNEGQIFSGKILDITNDKVSISLDGKNVIQARMAEAMMLSIGDELDFQIKENNGQSVYVKPVDIKQANMKDNAISRILENNNLSPSDKNYQIAESLMDHNMPLDRAGMQKIMQQSYKFPNADIDNLVNMNKLGIPVNESTIAQYEDMLSNNHQISENISKLGNAIEAYISELGENVSNSGMTSTEAIAGFENIMNSFTDIGEEASPEFIKSMADVKGELVTDNKPIETNFHSKIDIETLANKLSDNTGLEAKATSELMGKLSELGINDKTLEALVDNSKSPVQFMNNINELVKNLPEQDSSKLISELFSGKEFQSLLSETVKKKLSINSDDMNNPKEISDLYKSMYEKMDKLMNSLSSGAGSAGENMKEAGKSVQERIDFVQNLNELFGYTQMPVTISGNEMNSELFVYMNKNRNKDPKKDVSALLHLDMDHLGATDVHVSLSGDIVHTRFYVDDEESAKIIDEHMQILEKAINDSGYKLTNEVVAREKSVNSSGNMVVDEMFGIDLEKSVKRYSFDIKM